MDILTIIILFFSATISIVALFFSVWLPPHLDKINKIDSEFNLFSKFAYIVSKTNQVIFNPENKNNKIKGEILYIKLQFIIYKILNEYVYSQKFNIEKEKLLRNYWKEVEKIPWIINMTQGDKKNKAVDEFSIKIFELFFSLIKHKKVWKKWKLLLKLKKTQKGAINY